MRLRKYSFLMEKLIKKYRINDKDVGSVPVQLVYLENDIRNIVRHLGINKKDVPSKRSLLKRIARKKIYINYLKEQKGHSFVNEFTSDVCAFFEKEK